MKLKSLEMYQKVHSWKLIVSKFLKTVEVQVFELCISPLWKKKTGKNKQCWLLLFMSVIYLSKIHLNQYLLNDETGSDKKVL